MADRKTYAKVSLLTAVGVLAVGAGVWSLFFKADETRPAPGETYRSRLVKGVLTDQVRKPSKKSRAVRTDANGIRVASSGQPRPDLKLEQEDEAKLTEQMRQIYREMQEAFDRDDKTRVFALVRRLQSLDEWPDGIPASVKRRALQSLAWFGASGLSEAVGFLADSNPEIRDLTIDTFEQQLADSWDLGDYKLGDTMKAMVKVVTDADALESFYEQLNNMRPSVRADVALGVYESGNETAIKVFEQNMGDYMSSSDFDAASSEYEVKSREDVEKYQKDAALDESDAQKKQEYDDLYGPSDWGW